MTDMTKDPSAYPCHDDLILAQGRLVRMTVTGRELVVYGTLKYDDITGNATVAVYDGDHGDSDQVHHVSTVEDVKIGCG